MNIKKSPLFAESWSVAWRKKSYGSILDDTKTPFNVIKNSLRYWAADPFLFSFKDRIFIFAELYDYVRCRGVLGYCEIINSKPTKWKPVIVEPYHLSFPYIFKKDDEIYIMPESNSAEELYIYRAVHFPDKWEKIKTLRAGVKYADTTFLNNSEGCYALTYEVSDSDKQGLWLLDLENKLNDKLLNFNDMELRRPAGKIMYDKNIRCAQNCIGDYGKGLIFYNYSFENGNYCEREILRLSPENILLSKHLYLDGMHTYNFSEDFEVIDIKTRRFNLFNLFFRFINKIKKVLH